MTTIKSDTDDTMAGQVRKTNAECKSTSPGPMTPEKTCQRIQLRIEPGHATCA